LDDPQQVEVESVPLELAEDCAPSLVSLKLMQAVSLVCGVLAGVAVMV
jgi:hypothetical protein